ncbi:MAG TPA: hypothetical protein VMS75_00780 [Terriglobales bacterium]|nr:hypothetical protein [Terriglobales bacterium]
MKKTLLLAGLAVVAVFESAVYWNSRLLERAEAAAGAAAERVRLLERAGRAYPWNARVSLELGKAWFETGAQALADVATRDAAFEKSVGWFLRSLRLEPGSAAAHFELAQALQYMSYLALPAPATPFEEYKKAAALTGHNSQIYAEVGKVFLGRWSSLGPDERAFALEIIGKTLAGRDPGRLRDLLEVWYLHVRDFAVIEGVLPEDAGVLRDYARFLGEKALSLEAREKALSRAEAIDFAEAAREVERAQRSFEYGQVEDAAARVSTGLRLLRSIAFYQDLVREARIERQEYARILKTACLLAAEGRIEATRSLDDPDGFIESYLALEDDPLAVGEFEKFLSERGLIGDDAAAGSRPRDLRALALELGLDFKQNRYRDVTKAGEALESGAFVIPEAARPLYARVFGLVGDSYQKLDYLYEAERAYLKAVEAAPGRVEDLARLARCYERLGSERKLADVRARMAALLAPRSRDLGRRPVEPGRPARINVACEAGPSAWTLGFEAARPGGRPLVTVLWNGRVVREAYVEGGGLTFAAKAVSGENSLVVGSVCESLTLLALERAAAPLAEGSGLTKPPERD